MSTPRPNLVVMKFGGTSVEDARAIGRTAAIVAGRRARGLQAIVVVSAMARVTDQLLAAASAAGAGDKAGALAIAARLRHRHAETATELLPNPAALGRAHHAIHHDFDALDDLLRGIAAVGELTPRTNDLVVSFGERLSSQLVAEAFTEHGLPSAHLEARQVILTDDHFGKAVPLDAPIERALEQHALPLLEQALTPVMGGFIGSTLAGITTTLGRGGSDFSAAIVGGALHAGAIEIWTDVNGIMTTDPRICPDALRVRTISFEEAAELAYFGAKVLHPATILPAVQKSIPVWVLNSRDAANEGTEITAVAPHCRSPFKSIAAKKSSPSSTSSPPACSCRTAISRPSSTSSIKLPLRHRHGLDQSEVSISLTVDSNQQPARHLRRARPHRGRQIRGPQSPHLPGRRRHPRPQRHRRPSLLRHQSHINLRMISQGASEINMSFMIDEEDVEDAVRSLHRSLLQRPRPDRLRHPLA